MRAISVILPYYKRINAFKRALSINAWKLHSTAERSTEVVLVLDEPSEEQAVLEVVQARPGISWRVLINRRDHAWRNPAVAINVGIRHAKGDYVLVFSPESIYVNDVPSILFNTAREEEATFTVGRVHNCAREVIDAKGFQTAYEEGEPKRYYGSICAPRQALETIRGYDETNQSWGCDDDNVRERLILSGVQTRYVPRAKVLHPLEPNEIRRDVRRQEKEDQERDFYMCPQTVLANGADWGREFDEIIYEKEGLLLE
ncbi:MAG TPA: glycosyltransferase family 2 protein [Pyrinomonadaceae bacterium]|nr:glycosyltransferase family 2 protein [Pyrinomonadaceae bacterium]